MSLRQPGLLRGGDASEPDDRGAASAGSLLRRIGPRTRTLGGGLCSLGLLLQIQTTAEPPQSTVYVNKFFEVREREQPVKYVFSGDQRVATITGSMSTSPRIQRLRLQPGWNLRSLAVGGATLPVAGPGANPDGVVTACRLEPATGRWLEVSAAEMLPRGAILWIFANRHSTIGLRGSYGGAEAVTVAAGQGFLGTGGLESREPPPVEVGVEVWNYEAAAQGWRAYAAPLPEEQNGPPPLLAPGEALFLKNAVAIEWAAPPAAFAVRFHHPDHLRSSAVVTDAEGGLMEETAFHPFGPVRNQQHLLPVEEAYQYTQKERDRESGLHYFEARYLASTLARFSRPDSKYATLDTSSPADLKSLVADPQALNPYAYVQNNPIKFIDPQGEDKVKPRTDDASITLTLRTGNADPVEIPIATAGLSPLRPTGASGNLRENPQPSSWHLTRTSDRQSPELTRDYFSGKVFEEATLTVRSPGKGKEELFRIRLSNATIASMTVSAPGGDPRKATDSLDIVGTPPKAAPPPTEPQSSRGGNPFAPPPPFDVDKAVKQTARDFQEVLSQSQSK